MERDDLGKLRRELKGLTDDVRRGSRGRHSAELEYHLTRLTTAVSGFSHMGYRSMYPHHQPAELLAQIDTLLAQMDGIRELAGRVREVLLRPPSEEKPADSPGFNE